MIKNRTTQIIFQTIFCTLGVLGVFYSLNIFSGKFNPNFYVYYTHISNYICLGLMIACLVRTVRSANKKEDGLCNTAPTFTFMSVVLITATFLVYNILLASQNSVYDYFTTISNLLLHVILPIMFVLNWVLFYEHGNSKKFWPLLCLIMPLGYLAFILIRAAIIGGAQNPVIYPYYFLDIGKIGVGGFFMWIGILLVGFLLISYIYYLLDKHLKKRIEAKEKQGS